MISVLCPTRARPGNMRRLVESGLKTAHYPNSIEFIFYIDEDDQASKDTADSLPCKNIIGPRIVLSQMWNACAAVAQGPLYMHCGDDIVFRSPDWDAIVNSQFEAWPDKILLVYGDDGYQHEAMATHGFYHQRWIDALGYLVPPYFSSDFNDQWNMEIARAVGRLIYEPVIVTEHMHPQAGKAQWDITHQERLARQAADRPEDLYARLGNERIRDADKLRAAMRFV